MGPSDPGEGTVINTLILQRLRVNSLEVWSKVRRPAQGPAPHLPDDLWPIVASDVGFQGQSCPSSSSSPFSRSGGDGRRSRRERQAQLQSLFSKDPSPASSPPTTARNPVLEKRLPSSSLETKAGHCGGVAREWAGPRRGGAKAVYLTVWSRGPHSRRVTSPARLPTPLQDRTQHEMVSGHQPQPRLDKAASNRCVRDKGRTHGLGTKRRHPWGGRESLSKSETPPL